MITYTEAGPLWEWVLHMAARTRRAVTRAWGWIRYQLWYKKNFRWEIDLYERAAERIHGGDR